MKYHTEIMQTKKDIIKRIEISRISMMELFGERANGFYWLIIFPKKSSIIDVRLDSKYVSLQASGKTSGSFLDKSVP